ncbi:serine protease snake isoform X2 [Orussus abietinus]|uniref:serine protease snake isoform X2 n=1 Tax=Orussus abietinus TaxID=222816 RepID=UPI000625A9FE|nr:serine protease snake isoform X2 [Orussus abietinus]
MSGDDCSHLLDNASGRCSTIDECQEVKNMLLAGRRPDAICGFSGYSPIVCCPTSRSTVPVITNPSTSQSPFIDESGESNEERDYGRVARQKCAEYAKSVYAQILPPILSAGRKPVNVSLCAIKSKKLIVGGTKSEPKEFPHMAAVGYETDSGIRWQCGGTLVSENFVLTAAHCTFSINWGSAKWVRVGDLNLARDNDNAKPQERQIVERIRHPEYKKPSLYHDIALLRLDRPVKFDAYVRPACLRTLPEYSGDDVVTKAAATGWGGVDWADEEGSQDLLKVTLPMVSAQNCNQSFTRGPPDARIRNGIMGDWQLCAGELGRDTCQGDSGGPLQVFNNEQECMYDVIGVTSLGAFCGSVVPGIYSRVYHYVPWLESVIWS